MKKGLYGFEGVDLKSFLSIVFSVKRRGQSLAAVGINKMEFCKSRSSGLILKKTKTLWPLFMDGVQLSQAYSHFVEAVYFLPFSSQKFLVLISSTLEGWKAESTLAPPSGFWTRDGCNNSKEKWDSLKRVHFSRNKIIE